MATGLEKFLLVSDDETQEQEPADTSDAIVGLDTDVRYCACGCGTVLPPTYKWSYKRGHKLNAVSREVTADPDRPDFGDVKSGAFTGTRITKKMKDDVEGQMATVLAFLAMGISTRDPYCGGALTEQADKIAEKLVPIICKSPSMVKWLTRSTSLKDVLELAMVLAPVARAVADHHILHTQTTESVREQDQYLYPVS